MVSGGLPNIYEDKIENKIKLKDRHQWNNIGNNKLIQEIFKEFILVLLYKKHKDMMNLY